MTITTMTRPGRYDRPMPDLPGKVLNIDIADYEARADEILATVDQGGAVIVFDDKRDRLLGVLSREGWGQDDAFLGRDIADGRLPPIDELLADDDRAGESIPEI